MTEKEEILYYKLETAYKKYANAEFIDNDPIQIPHLYNLKEDIEISAFLTVLIAWGKRNMIIRSASELMNKMDHSPYQFILHFKESDLNVLKHFKYRTFCFDDLVFILNGLKSLYVSHNGLEAVFSKGYKEYKSIFGAIFYFRSKIIEIPHLIRSEKHLSNPANNSSAKRLNLFLRWMIRPDKEGVDFGLWKNIPVSELKIPLDVHTGNVSRQLNLLKRKQNDWKSVMELTSYLQKFDPFDPVKYDFSLFGMGINSA